MMENRSLENNIEKSKPVKVELRSLELGDLYSGLWYYNDPNKQKTPKINLELSIDSITNFEYPENIQKETGIVGYERTIIKEKDLEKLKNEYINIAKEENKKKLDESVIKSISERNLSLDILMSLTNQEFPQKTFFHQMGYYAGESSAQKYVEQFAQEKFLLQKLFDPSTISSLKEKVNSVFQHYPSGFSRNAVEFSVFDKKTNICIKNEIDPSEITNYEEKIKNGEVYLSTADKGLPTTDMPYGDTQNRTVKFSNFDIFSKKPIFGFFPDDYFKSYLEGVIKEYRKINNAKLSIDKQKIPSKMSRNDFNMKELEEWMKLGRNKMYKEDFSTEEWSNFGKPKIPTNMFASIFRMMEYEEEVNDFLKTGIAKGNWVYQKADSSKDQNATSEYFHKLFEKHGGIYKNKPQQGENEKEKIGGGYAEETLIPIFIGNDNVPNLRWGHAKYACFWTSKGLNLLKIKHTDSIKE